jgi:hypothetical protein
MPDMQPRTDGMTTTLSLRHVVLQLAAAHPDDRRWVLAQLPAQRRQLVEQLLGEASALGIRDFRPWLDALAARQRNARTGDAAGAHQALAADVMTNAGLVAGENTTQTARWASWLLSRPDADTLPFETRVTLDALTTREETAALPEGLRQARVPPAWRALLTHALAERAA